LTGVIKTPYSGMTWF